MHKTKSSAYSEKFKDPRWQQKRLEVFQRDGFKCLDCGATDRQLHVHHLYYISKRDPWAYPLGSLRTLCEICHDHESSDDDEWNPNTQREWETIFHTGIPGSKYGLDFAYEFDQWRKKSGLDAEEMIYELMLSMQYMAAHSDAKSVEVGV